MWLLTRRDDILRVLADWERFTTDSPASTIRDIFGSHMLTTDGDEQMPIQAGSSGGAMIVQRALGAVVPSAIARTLTVDPGMIETVIDRFRFSPGSPRSR